MKEIQLTQGKVALVDDEDYEWLSKWKWCVTKLNGKVKDVARRTCCSDGEWRTLRLHRLIMGLQFGDKRLTDHVNRNPLDNRRENLRICTNAQNAWNRGKQKSNISGYKGVSFHKPTKKWRAIIASNNKEYRLGSFVEIGDAAMVYNEAALRHHGEFAYQNEASQ